MNDLSVRDYEITGNFFNTLHDLPFFSIQYYIYFVIRIKIEARNEWTLFMKEGQNE